MLVFDDSFEYTMWHKGRENTTLLLLSVDVWHPDIPTDRWKMDFPSVERSELDGKEAPTGSLKIM